MAFSDDDIRAIRRSKEKKVWLAHKYGVSRITIYHIQKKITHVNVPDYAPDEIALAPDNVELSPPFYETTVRYGIDKTDNAKTRGVK